MIKCLLSEYFAVVMGGHGWLKLLGFTFEEMTT